MIHPDPTKIPDRIKKSYFGRQVSLSQFSTLFNLIKKKEKSSNDPTNYSGRVHRRTPKSEPRLIVSSRAAVNIINSILYGVVLHDSTFSRTNRRSVIRVAATNCVWSGRFGRCLGHEIVVKTLIWCHPRTSLVVVIHETRLRQPVTGTGKDY